MSHIGVIPGAQINKHAVKSVTFDGVTANLGIVGDVDLFTVTGDILVVSILAVCSAGLTEGGATAELELGITTSTALFLPQTQPIDIDTNEVWTSASPTLSGEAPAATQLNIVVNGTANDILATVVNDTVDTGTLNFYLTWQALSIGALVMAA